MSHSFLTFGCEQSAVVETERPSVCGSLFCGRSLLQEGKGRDVCQKYLWFIFSCVAVHNVKLGLNPLLDNRYSQTHIMSRSKNLNISVDNKEDEIHSKDDIVAGESKNPNGLPLHVAPCFPLSPSTGPMHSKK